ncbi:transposase [Streptomyces inhibens]|uniref:transposase n=1 Tax=Streptomyces inhibens TaxID=2293571 RepID=UPI003CCA55E0
MGTSKYSPEFRADAVTLYHPSPSGTYASVAKDLGVNHETLRTWVRDAEQVARPGVVEATAMEKENRQLRARVRNSSSSGRSCGGPRSISRPRPAGEQPLPVRRGSPWRLRRQAALPAGGGAKQQRGFTGQAADRNYRSRQRIHRPY